MLKTDGIAYDNYTTAEVAAIVLPETGAVVYDSDLQTLVKNDGTPGLPIWNPIGGSGTQDYPASFVDPQNGNNGTGVFGDGNKPFQTVTAAMSAAVTAGYPRVVLKAGTYAEFISLVDQGLYHCESGVVFIAGGFRDLSSTGKKAKITGYAVFLASATPLQIQSDAEVDIEFDHVDARTLLIAYNDAIVRMVLNRARTSGFNGTGGGALIRNNANVNIVIREYFYSQHEPLQWRFATNKTVLICPDVRVIANYTSSYGNVNKNILSAVSCNGVDFEYYIQGDLKNTHPVFTNGSGVLVVDCANGVGRINGNVNSGVHNTIECRYIVSKFDLTINGDSISTTNNVFRTWKTGSAAVSDVKIKLMNGRVSGAFASNLGRGRTIYISNCSVEVDSGNIFIPTGGGAELSFMYLYNCSLKSDNISESFSGFGLTTVIGCQNVMSSEVLGVGAIDIFGGFSTVPALEVPQI